MPLVPARCTCCGAALTLDPSQEAAVCPYCNTPFIVEKAINVAADICVLTNRNIVIDTITI